MERKILERLKKWKNRKDRKPLLLEGARQTGKTWIAKEFGSRYYSDTEQSFSYKYSFDADNNLVLNDETLEKIK